MTTAAVAVVLPTRNRAELAKRAIASLLAQRECDFTLFVSDNSGNPAEAKSLAVFCRDSNDPRVTYLRPPKELTQPRHWDWAIGRVLEQSKASHLTVHYDRKITKRGELARLLKTASEFPSRLVGFASDSVVEANGGYVVVRPPWSGVLAEVSTARVIELISRAAVESVGHAMPFLSNCIAPREVLYDVRTKFGSFCDSTAPDSCFAFRFCAADERYLFLDRPIAVVYAPYRSAGAGYLRNEGGDYGDMRKLWGDRPWADAAPVPGISLGKNVLFHEYELVRRATGALPPLDPSAYLADLGAGLPLVSNADERSRLRKLLEEHGWHAEQMSPERLRDRLTFGRIAASLSYRLRKLSGRGVSTRTFLREEEAIEHALAHPRPRSRVNPLLEPLHGVIVDR